MEKERQWSLETKLNHPPEVPLHPGNKPLLQPVYLSAKFTPAADVPYGDQFIYSRISNPTTRQLELTLAELQGQEDCIVLASGIAAISGTLLSLLKTGDHMITFRELYKPARVFIKDFLTRFGISHTILSLENLDELETAIRPGITKIIHFESPSNPNLAIADIGYIVKAARKHNVIVTMDSTFSGLHQYQNSGIDLFIQSLTKFGNGHGDVIAGSVAGKKDLIEIVREAVLYLGPALDPQASYLIQRGLRTYKIRFEQQTKNAEEIAAFLSTHKMIKRVFYPGLKNHPRHDLARKQMKEMGAVVSFEIDEKAGTAAEFCHKLELIQFSASLGSTESIICPTLAFFGLDLSVADRNEMGINEHTVRLSVGLEHPDDLRKDLDKALS